MLKSVNSVKSKAFRTLGGLIPEGELIRKNSDIADIWGPRSIRKSPGYQLLRSNKIFQLEQKREIKAVSLKTLKPMVSVTL